MHILRLVAAVTVVLMSRSMIRRLVARSNAADKLCVVVSETSETVVVIGATLGFWFYQYFCNKGSSKVEHYFLMLNWRCETFRIFVYLWRLDFVAEKKNRKIHAWTWNLIDFVIGHTWISLNYIYLLYFSINSRSSQGYVR
jgi:hypothetical protein